MKHKLFHLNGTMGHIWEKEKGYWNANEKE